MRIVRGSVRDGRAQREVAEGLRAEILRGDLAPGQRLVEGDLTERFGASRAGVRAALMDLTAEGLVERIQHRGARVRVVSIDEAIEITECRMVLEGLCAAKAARRRSEEDGAELTELGRRMRVAVEDGDLLGYSELNQTLHGRIREISGQRTAARTIERLRDQFVRHQFRLALRPGRAATSLPEHERIIDAVVAGNADAAERAMRAHLRSVVTALRQAADRA
jgi:DNA-binding GntR family transcriptional regulator